MKKSILALAISLLAFACSTPESNTEFNDEAEARHEVVFDLTDNQWNLTELNGGEFELSEGFDTAPYIAFVREEEENKITGNAGCNSYFGDYELSEGNSISFSKMGATMMACPNHELEQSYLDAVETTVSFIIDQNTLSFLNEEGEVVARFENGEKASED